MCASCLVCGRYLPPHAMACALKDLLQAVLTEFVDADFATEDGIIDNLVTTLHRANIRNPNDLGFLCSAGGGVPQRVYDTLDPNMSELSKKLLGKACAGLRTLIPGVIGLVTLSLACAPLPAAGTASTPKRGLDKCRPGTLAVPRVASPAVAGPLAPSVAQAACPYPVTLASRDARRMDDAVDAALILFKSYATNTERYMATFGSSTYTHAKLAVLRRCLQAKTRSAPALKSKVLDARRFLDWCRSQAYDPLALTEWEVAAWVGEKAVATKSGGPGALSTLRWLEAAFGVRMHAQSSLVRTQADSMHCAPRPRPIPARCPSEHQVCQWEDVLADLDGPRGNTLLRRHLLRPDSRDVEMV